jgi:hypothetical protein
MLFDRSETELLTELWLDAEPLLEGATVGVLLEQALDRERAAKARGAEKAAQFFAHVVDTLLRATDEQVAAKRLGLEDMMNDKPCGDLERACQEAREKWQAALRKDIGDAPPVIESLGPETPPSSGMIRKETIALRHRYDELADKLRECYEKHNIPLKEQAWSRIKNH